MEGCRKRTFDELAVDMPEVLLDMGQDILRNAPPSKICKQSHSSITPQLLGETLRPDSKDHAQICDDEWKSLDCLLLESGNYEPGSKDRAQCLERLYANLRRLLDDGLAVSTGCTEIDVNASACCDDEWLDFLHRDKEGRPVKADCADRAESPSSETLSCRETPAGSPKNHMWQDE